MEREPMDSRHGSDRVLIAIRFSPGDEEGYIVYSSTRFDHGRAGARVRTHELGAVIEAATDALDTGEPLTDEEMDEILS